jgi:tetratricopeptide (TPR) repeat protein
MKNRWLNGLIPALFASILFFGCERQPGEKLYADALAEWEQGNKVRARALLEKSIRRRTGSVENADAWNRLGLLLWEMDETAEALEAFNESARIKPGQFDVLCNLGVANSANDRLDEAERVLREASLLRPNDPRPLAYAGVVYVRSSKWADAARNLRRAIERNPADPRMQTALALSELHSIGAGPALERLQRVVKANPSYAPALFNLATIESQWLNRSERAKEYLEHYLQKASGVDAYSALARTRLQALSAPAENPALSIPEPAERDPAVAARLFQTALTAHRTGKIAQAIEGYTDALEADNTYERAYYNLGLAYYSQGDMILAGEAFARAVELNPAYVEARYNLALVNHYHLGRSDLATQQLQIALKQRPDYEPAVELLNRIKN